MKKIDIKRIWGLAVLTALFCLLPSAAQAQLTIDQQQPVIDTSVGGSAIGGGSQQKLAQVVTAGMSGLLTEVRLPVACDAGSDLIVEIQGITGNKPNGNVLTSQTVPGSTIPPGASFKDIVFSTPVAFAVGNQFAIVLSSAGSCGIFQGPVGDSYPGGNAFFDAPNPVGDWVCICDFAGAHFDLPFQTLVEVRSFDQPPRCDLAQPSRNLLWPSNLKLIPVEIIGVTDPDNDDVAINITGVTQDEPVNGPGYGDTSPDAIIQGDSALLRAERSGKGNGRVYSIQFTAEDGRGGSCTGSVLVAVPLSLNPGQSAIDDGQLYDSTQP